MDVYAGLLEENGTERPGGFKAGRTASVSGIGRVCRRGARAEVERADAGTRAGRECGRPAELGWASRKREIGCGGYEGAGGFRGETCGSVSTRRSVGAERRLGKLLRGSGLGIGQ